MVVELRQSKHRASMCIVDLCTGSHVGTWDVATMQPICLLQCGGSCLVVFLMQNGSMMLDVWNGCATMQFIFRECHHSTYHTLQSGQKQTCQAATRGFQKDYATASLNWFPFQVPS